MIVICLLNEKKGEKIGKNIENMKNGIKAKFKK